MGHKSIRILDEKMGPQRLARARTKARELMGGMLLAELRKHVGVTQVELAESLGVAQATISQMEGQEDMQISTLRRLVEALGGQLRISVELPGLNVDLAPFDQPAIGDGTAEVRGARDKASAIAR